MNRRFHRCMVLVFLFLLSTSLFMGVCTQMVRAATFSVTIWAWDPIGWETNCPIYWNGILQPYTTPHTFPSVNSGDTFMVPNISSGYSFDSWNTGETTTYITVYSAGTYTALYGCYHVSIQAWDPYQYWSTLNGESVYEDGADTGLVTPCTVTGMVGTHTLSVPSVDRFNYPFSRWNSGQKSNSITVSSGATLNAYYMNLFTTRITPSLWTMDAGQFETFTAMPSGGTESYVSYQWYLDGGRLNGATSSTFSFDSATWGASSSARACS